MHSANRSGSAPARGRQGMVASSQPLASAAGLEILKERGTAVDAALAMNAMLAVTEPYMCGPGGDLFALLWEPGTRQLLGLNASGRSAAGRALPALREGLGDRATIPMRGGFSVTTPGAVDGWLALHARGGRLPLSRIFAPAIAVARDGFNVQPATARGWAVAVADITADADVAGHLGSFLRCFTVDGQAPAAGGRMVNPDLADTLEAIAQDGRAAFYEGDNAARLCATVGAAGGALDDGDLAGLHAEWVTPLRGHYRGHEVAELPPNGQGACVLQMLHLMQRSPVAPSRADPRWWHWVLEAKKLAFADRSRYYADPSFATVPLTQLLSMDYAAARARLINPERAGEPDPGALPGTDTTYFAAADAEGQMVSAIQSIFNPFGSALVVPGGGYALHSRGCAFSLDATHANAYAPGKRPFHTIIPAFALRDGRPWLAFGVIGADMQPQGQVQVLSNLLDHGMDVQAAGSLPRIRHVGGRQPNGAQEDSVVWFEAGFAPAVLEGLAARGHVLREVTPAQGNFMGGYQGILCDSTAGRYEGGSDPRFDGCALGF